MVQASSTLLPALLVGVFALLSHWARKNKSAEITLFVVLVFASLLVVALGALLIVAGFVQTVPGNLLPQSAFIAIAVAVTFAGLAGLALCTPPLWSIVGRSGRNFWSNPPTFFALWLLVMVLMLAAVGFVTVLSTDVDTLASSLGGGISPSDVAASQLPMIIVAVLGVGLFVRRSPREVVERLGYGALSARDLAVCALFIAGALALSVVTDALFAAVQPDLYDRVGELSAQLFTTQGMSLPSVVLFGLALGLGAALGEESLFRGAVQPVFGILPTSLLFASLHVQYGPSVSLGYVLLLSVGLGLLRKRINTSAAFVSHAGYNFATVMLGYLLGG